MVKVIKRVERKLTYNLNCGVCYAALEYSYEDIKTKQEMYQGHIRYVTCPDCNNDITVNE